MYYIYLHDKLHTMVDEYIKYFEVSIVLMKLERLKVDIDKKKYD